MMRPSQGRGLDSPGVDRTSRPIDLMHLARQTLGDDGLAGEVLRMFEQQVTRYFERVRTSNDEFEITLGLYTLKGAAQGVGAMALAAQARAAETEFSEHGALDEETLADLEMAVTEVCEYIASIVRD